MCKKNLVSSMGQTSSERKTMVAASWLLLFCDCMLSRTFSGSRRAGRWRERIAKIVPMIPYRSVRCNIVMGVFFGKRLCLREKLECSSTFLTIRISAYMAGVGGVRVEGVEDFYPCSKIYFCEYSLEGGLF